MELPEVEVAEADQPYDDGRIYIDSESEDCNLCRFIVYCVKKITTFSLKSVLNLTCFYQIWCKIPVRNPGRKVKFCRYGIPAKPLIPAVTGIATGIPVG